MVAVSVDDGWEPVREFFGAPPYLGSEPGAHAWRSTSSEKATVASCFCTARGACPNIKFPESYVVGKDGRIVGFFRARSSGRIPPRARI